MTPTAPITDDARAVFRTHVAAPLFEATKAHYARAHMRIHHAHAVMLGDQGLLGADEQAALVAALQNIESAPSFRGCDYDDRFEDFFFFVEDELGKAVGRDTAGRLHTGRSRNDMDHTMFKLVLRERLLSLLDSLNDVIEAGLNLAAREHDTLMVAYTHGQPAQPTTFGHYLCAIIEMLLRDVDRLLAAGESLRECPLGAAAITTTGFPIDRRLTAELLGFDSVQENSYGCIAACDYMLGVYAALKVLFIGTGRVAQDMERFAAYETGYLKLADAHCATSSIMPQKRNPIAIEQVRLKSALVVGRCDAVTDALRNTPFTDVNDSETETQVLGLEAFDKAEATLSLLRNIFETLNVDESVARRHIDASCITITELADSLVRSEGIAFRTAHEVASHVAGEALAESVPLAAVEYARFVAAYQAVVGREPRTTARELARFVSVEHFIAVRDRTGGPAPGALHKSMQRYRTLAAEAARTTARWRETSDRAARALERRVAEVARYGTPRSAQLELPEKAA